MLQQRATVHYQDGTTEAVELTQYELGQFDRWALKAGYTAPRGGYIVEAMPTMWLRFGAWCALFRNTDKGKPSFDAWDRTVIEVEAEQKAAAVDPTQTDTQGEPSPE